MMSDFWERKYYYTCSYIYIYIFVFKRWWNTLIHNVYMHTYLSRFYCMYREIFAPILFYAPITLVAMVRYQRANLRLDECQCLILSFFKHNCVWANSILGETLFKCRRAKITQGENNPIYSKYLIYMYIVCLYIQL